MPASFWSSLEPIPPSRWSVCHPPGWLIVVAYRPLTDSVSPAGVHWLLAGGLAYSAGLIFFAWTKLPFNHAVWHLFVLIGSACHYFAVLFYVVPT
jgi:hemolysin III